MANITRQVLIELVRFFAAQIAFLEGRMAPFERSGTSKRKYPGEAEAEYILKYIETAPIGKRNAFITKLQNMQENEKRLKRTGRRAVSPVPREPTESITQLAASVLMTRGRLSQFKRCLHCGSWLYARFRSQKFCADPQKRCQWNHYHTPEWRKKHREPRRKYSSKYRRNDGRKL